MVLGVRHRVLEDLPIDDVELDVVAALVEVRRG